MKKLLIVLTMAFFCLTLCSCSLSNLSEDKSSSAENNLIDGKAEEESNALEITANPTEQTANEVPIERDTFIEKLISFGFTEDEAISSAQLLRQCGIPSIDACEPTDPNATLDGLISFRGKLDDDRTVWFTVDNRKIFYISFNGEDLYDEDKGGYLKNFNDVHIPETYVSSATKIALKDQTESVLDKYFLSDVRYYDAWAVGREDDTYMVQCQISDGSLLSDNWIFGYVWYEQQNGEYKPTAVKINGKHYEVK